MNTEVLPFNIMWNLIQCATGNPLNIFLSNIGLASVLKTFPSFLGSDLDFKLNLDSSFETELEFEFVRACHHKFIEYLFYFRPLWFLYPVEVGDYIHSYNRATFLAPQSL